VGKPLLLALGALAVIGAVAACQEVTPPSPAGTTGGTGGAGGACPMGPAPMFTLTITAAHGPVPADTQINISWSAGEEPAFALGDPMTWKTLDDANVICDVDRGKPPPEDLPALVCHLWTIGATQIEVRAASFTPFVKTFSPPVSAHCQGPVPTEINVRLDPQG
jgi:hypothetical protein